MVAIFSEKKILKIIIYKIFEIQEGILKLQT